MRHALKRAASTGAVLALAFALAACGGGDDGDDGATGEASGNITVWAMGAEGEKLGVLAQDFMAENPDIKVNVTPIAWDVAHDKLLTSVAGGKTPDVSQMGTTWMGEFAKTGALEEVPDDIDLDSFFEGAKDTAVVDDTPFGVPWYVETRVLYYRTDIAREGRHHGRPERWDELKAMAKAMKEKGGAKYGISLSPNNWQELMPFVWQNGGEGVDQEGVHLRHARGRRGARVLPVVLRGGPDPPSVPEGFDVTQGFIDGTHPMFFSGPWHMSLIEEQGGAELEASGTSRRCRRRRRHLLRRRQRPRRLQVRRDKDAAWQFVRYLLDPAVQQKWYTTVSALPSVESAWERASSRPTQARALRRAAQGREVAAADPEVGADRRRGRQHRDGEGDERRLLR